MAETDTVSSRTLTVQTQVPSGLGSILQHSHLSLLAEGPGYKLWIPLHLEIDEFGEFTPNLGTPEIIDINGSDRSWRVQTPLNVTLTDHSDRPLGDILSLSSTGLTLRMQDNLDGEQKFVGRVLNLHLPENKLVELQLELVRADRHILSAKFECLNHGQEIIRQFLFTLHKSRNSKLYDGMKTFL